MPSAVTPDTLALGVWLLRCPDPAYSCLPQLRVGCTSSRAERSRRGILVRSGFVLTDAFANGLGISRIATGEPIDPSDYLTFGAGISQRPKPIRELLRSANLQHARV